MAALVSSLCEAADIDDSEFRLTGPLVRAGIKLDHEAALIRTRLKHGDRQWVGAAAARLPNVKKDLLRLYLADDLAQAGCYDGWEMIEAAIVEGSVAEQEAALFGVESFQGMKDPAGKPIDAARPKP